MADNIVSIVIRGVNQTGAAIQQAQQQLNGLQRAVKAIPAFGGIAGAVAGVVSVAALTRAVGNFINEAKDAELQQAQLNNVIRSTGGIAGVTAGHINNLAAEMQDLTRYEDDATIGAANMLLTFTNIRGETFDQALTAVLDLSTAMGQDLKTSAIQVGKALNDPVAGMQALRRVGVQFTDAQEETVKKLLDTNQGLEAQKLILAELQKEFGGSAEAAGNTFAGALDIARNKIGDMKETLGQGFMDVLQPALEDMNQGMLSTLQEVIVPNFVTGMQSMFDQLGTLDVTSWYKDAFAELAGGQTVTFDLASAMNEVGRQIALGGAELQGFAGNVRATFGVAKAIVGGFGTFFGGIFAVAGEQINDFMDAVSAGFSRVKALMRLDFAGAAGFAQQAQQALARVQAGFVGYSGAVRQAGLEWGTAIRDYDADLASIQARYEMLRIGVNNAFAPPPALGEGNPVDEFRANRFPDEETITNGAKQAAYNWGKAGTDSAKKWKDEYGEFIANFIESATTKAQSAAKGLLDLTGNGTGGDLFAPGANGAFENIFRALDVAKLGDASPWAAQLGLTQEEAKKIGADFQRGIFSEGVQSLIDVDALVNEAKMADLAQKSKDAFVKAIAAKAGVGTTVVGAMFGLEGTTGTGQGAASGAQKAVDSAMQQVAGALGDTVAGKDFAGRIIGYGDRIWGYFEQGIVDKAKGSTALERAIWAMVSAAISGQTGGSVGDAVRGGGGQ